MRRYIDVLANKVVIRLPVDFWILLGPSSLIGFGDIIRTITLSWVLISDFNNSALLSILLIANAIAKISAPLLVGTLINSRNQRYILFLCLIVGLSATCLMLLLFSEPIFPYILPFLEFLISSAGMGFIVARQSLLRGILRDKQKDCAAGYLRASYYSTGIIAPVMAGVLLTTNQPVYAILLNASFFMTALFFVLFFREPEKRKPANEILYQGLIEKIYFVITFYKKNPKVRNGLVYFALTNFALSPLGMIVPIFVNRAFGFGPVALGFSEVALGIGAIIGALSAAMIKDWSLSNASGILAVLFTIIFACGHLGENWFYLFVFALFGIGMNIAIFGAKVDSLFMKDIPRELYPKIIGVQSMIVGLAFPLGLIMSGLLFQTQENFLYLPFCSALIAIVGMGLLHMSSKATSNVELA